MQQFSLSMLFLVGVNHQVILTRLYYQLILLFTPNSTNFLVYTQRGLKCANNHRGSQMVEIDSIDRFG